MFSVWQRPQIVWGGGDEAGSGGEGSKGRSKNEMKTQREINARLAERKKQGFKGSAAFTPEINDLVAQRERDRAATARNTAGTKYTGLKDMFDGGGPGASGPQFRGGPLSGVTNPFFGGGGGSGSTPTPAPRQRIGTKGMTSAQRTALTDAGYEVTKGGNVKKNGGTVAGSNFSGSREVDAIMNNGPLSGERGSFGDAFAAARKKAGGDGGTFTFGGKQFTTNIDRAPKTSLRPKLRPTTVSPAAPAAAPIIDYDSLYQDAAYGPGGIGAAPFGLPAPSRELPTGLKPAPPPLRGPAPSPSSFDLDRALSTPFNIDDNIYMTEDENQLLRNRASRNIGDLISDDVSALERSTLMAQPISDLELDGLDSVLGPDYPPATDAALFGNYGNFAGQGNLPAYTTSFDDVSSTKSITDVPSSVLADMVPAGSRRGAGGLFDEDRARVVASSEGFQGLDTFLPELFSSAKESIVDAFTPDARPEVAPYAPEMPVPPPMPVQKRPEGVLASMENIGRVATEAEKADPTIDLRKGRPDRLMFGLAGKLGAENTAKLMAVAAQDMARLNEAMPLGSEITGYGEGSIDPRLADAANIQRNVPTMVGDPNVVAQLAQKAEDSIAAIIEDTTAGLNDRTKKALSSKIMEDGFKGAIFDGKFNTDAFMAQSAQVLGGIAPMVAAGTLNPYLGMAVAGAATAGDVSGLVEQKIRARADAGDFGAINPSQLDAVIQQAKMQTTLPSAALGAAGMGIFGKTKIGGMVGEIVAETVAESSLAQTSSTLNTDPLLRVDPATGKMPNEGNLFDYAGDDAALLALVGSAPLAAFTPTQMTLQPATVEDVGTGTGTPSVAESLGQAFGRSGIPRAAGLTRNVLGGTPTAAAAGDVLGTTPVKPAPSGIATVPQDNVLNIPGVNQESLIPPQPAPPLTDVPADRGPIPGDQSFVPGDKAALQAATVKKTGEKKAAPDIDAQTPLTPEQIANVSPKAGAELDAASKQIDKNGRSRPENVSAAIDLMKKDGKNSASYLQRKLRINYSEAEAINKQLEAEGYLSPENNLGARKILTTDPTTAAEELISETAPTVNLADVAANKNTALQGAAAEIDNTLGTTDNMRHDEMIGSSGGLTGSQIYGNVVRALQGKDTVTRVEIMEMTPTMSDGVAGKVLDQLKDMGGVIGGKDANGVFRVSQSAVAKEIGVPYENPNKIVMKIKKPDSSVGAMDNRLRSALTQELLRRDPNTDAPFNEFFYDQLNQKLKDTDQNLSSLPPDPRALELAQLNRDGPLLTGGVLRTFPTTGIDSLSPLANQLYTPEQRANMQRDRQIANVQREKARLEAEAMAPLNRAQAALDAVVDPVPAAIQSVEAQRAEMLAANKTYQDYINTRAQISALDGVTKEQAEREAFAAVKQRIEDQQQKLLNAVNAEGGTAAITNAANNEIAKLEAQLNAVKEVILNGKTPFPVNLPATPEFTTPQTKAQLAALTTSVEAPAMAPLVPPASPESVGEADITPPTLAEFIEIQRAKPRDGVPVDPLAAPVEMPPFQQEQLALDLQGGSAVATPEGIMSLVDRTSKAPAAVDAVNPVASPEISFEEAMAKVAEAPTARAPKDAGPLVLTDPVTQGGIASAVPGRIPKDKLTTRFDSNLPVDSPFSLENQLARYAERRAKAAVKDKTAPVVSTKDPILKATEEISKENQIEQDRINARNAALKGLATLRSPLRVTGIPDDDTVYEDVEEQTLPDELLTEPFNNTPPEDTGGEGTGTPRESAPKYVPVDMNNENNDDLGCPSGYARVFDPATGQPICGRIDEPSAPGPAAPAEEAEEEEDGVVIDIPIVERPKISPYYVPEMVESNYTPYVPGRRASTQ